MPATRVKSAGPAHSAQPIALNGTRRGVWATAGVATRATARIRNRMAAGPGWGRLLVTSPGEEAAISIRRRARPPTGGPAPRRAGEGVVGAEAAGHRAR